MKSMVHDNTIRVSGIRRMYLEKIAMKRKLSKLKNMVPFAPSSRSVPTDVEILNLAINYISDLQFVLLTNPLDNVGETPASEAALGTQTTSPSPTPPAPRQPLGVLNAQPVSPQEPAPTMPGHLVEKVSPSSPDKLS